MNPDPLQWLWDGVTDFQTKFDDLHTRAMRNFHRAYDVAQHEENCGLKSSQSRIPCSCCKGSLTFQEANHIKERLAAQRTAPNPKDREFKPVPAAACWGLENCREFFALNSDKESISAAFAVEISKNLLFGSSGLVTRTLEHWKALLKDASRLIESRSSSNRAPRRRRRSPKRRRRKVKASSLL